MKVKYLALLSVAFLAQACGENESSSNVNAEVINKEQQIAANEKVIDSLQKANAPAQEVATTAPTTQNVNQQEADKKEEAANAELVRIGKHNITLQWISFDKNTPGSVNISKISDNKYKIEGGQKSKTNADYLKINGTLTALNKNELIFEGSLIYQVAGNNNGSACDKSGTLKFKSTQSRKYWRMQEMTNCEGGMLTDYVDIFF